MNIYNPKRGTYIGDSDIKAVGENHFNGTVTEEYTTEVVVDGGGRDVQGYLLSSENPVFESIAIGVIDMGSRKDWVHIDIKQVSDEKLQELIKTQDDETIKQAAVAKNRYLSEVTGYEVDMLKEKAKSASKGYDSLSEL